MTENKRCVFVTRSLAGDMMSLVGHYQPNFAHVIGFNLGKRF